MTAALARSACVQETGKNCPMINGKACNSAERALDCRFKSDYETLISPFKFLCLSVGLDVRANVLQHFFADGCSG
jgi:hypothetical protein